MFSVQAPTKLARTSFSATVHHSVICTLAAPSGRWHRLIQRSESPRRETDRSSQW
jgi:hypothetical protein